MIANRSPPMPFIAGSTTPSVAFAAMAASIALPPSSKTRAPACDASVWLVATIPNFVITMERAWSRPDGAFASSWANPGIPAAAIAAKISVCLFMNMSLLIRPSFGALERPSNTETCHFSGVADQQQPVIDSRDVPGLALHRGKSRHLVEAVRRGLHHNHVAFFGGDHQLIAG